MKIYDRQAEVSFLGASAFYMPKKAAPVLEAASGKAVLFHCLLHGVKYFCIL